MGNKKQNDEANFVTNTDVDIESNIRQPSIFENSDHYDIGKSISRCDIISNIIKIF